MAPRSPPLPLHPPLHPPLQPPPRSPPCGLTRYDTTGAAWTYDFAPLAAAPLTADGERFSFRLALCGVAEAACRPAACVNASVCEPYDENLAQHGAAVAFVRGAVAPGPAGRGGCFEERPQRSAAACTAPCSVLAPATLPAKKGGELQPHSSRWELSSTERQPHVSPLLRFSPQARRRLHTPPASPLTRPPTPCCRPLTSPPSPPTAAAAGLVPPPGPTPQAQLGAASPHQLHRGRPQHTPPDRPRRVRRRGGQRRRRRPPPPRGRVRLRGAPDGGCCTADSSPRPVARPAQPKGVDALTQPRHCAPSPSLRCGHASPASRSVGARATGARATRPQASSGARWDTSRRPLSTKSIVHRHSSITNRWHASRRRAAQTRRTARSAAPLPAPPPPSRASCPPASPRRRRPRSTPPSAGALSSRCCSRSASRPPQRVRGRAEAAGERAPTGGLPTTRGSPLGALDCRETAGRPAAPAAAGDDAVLPGALRCLEPRAARRQRRLAGGRRRRGALRHVGRRRQQGRPRGGGAASPRPAACARLGRSGRCALVRGRGYNLGYTCTLRAHCESQKPLACV